MFNRRKFLAGAASALPAWAARGADLPAGKSAKKQPNFLLLMSDQHKRSCMGAAGDQVAKTPHLDKLMAESVAFSSAYCSNPVCAPSRASLMTGLYSHNIETQSNATPYSYKHKTMAHNLGAAGYFTGLIGKMHWVDGQTHGFDYRLEFNDWMQYLGPKAKLYAEETGGLRNSGAGLPEIESIWGKGYNPWAGEITHDGREGSVAVGRASLLPEEDHFDSFVARESVRFLREYAKEDQPFFLITSFLKPHEPFMPAKRFADMFKAEDMALPATWKSAKLDTLPKEVQDSIRRDGPTPEMSDADEVKQRIAMYYGCVAQMDDCVGQVLQALQELDLERDTIVCYTADHGDMVGDLGLWGKFQFYEGSCGVPLMFRIPGRESAKRDVPVSLVSLMATICDLCGVPCSRNDGESFMGLIHGGGAGKPVYAEFALGTRGAKYMLREGEWKYTHWVFDRDELYNLKNDPQELTNLAGVAAYAGQRDAMKQKLLAWHTPTDEAIVAAHQKKA